MDKITLKRYEVNELAAALREMSGRQEVVKDGDGKLHGIIAQPYDFTYQARYGFAKTLRAIAPDMETYESVRKEVASKKFPEGTDDTRDEEYRKFMIESVEIEVHKVKIVDVKIDTNKLSPQTIAALLPMLTED